MITNKTSLVRSQLKKEQELQWPGIIYKLYEEKDVQQFIAEFRDLAVISRWSVRVTLVQLRLCLTGLVKP